MAFLLKIEKTLEEIQRQQTRLLRKQLTYCAQSVPYFQKQMKELNVDIDAIRSLDVLQQLPVLNKSVIREQQEQFRGVAFLTDEVKKSYSSGSTGQPFATYFDKPTWYRKKFFIKLRARFACGMKFGQRVAILECEAGEVIAKRNKNAWLSDAVLKVRVFSLFQDSSSLLQQLAELDPQNIYAYPSHLFELATTFSLSNKGSSAEKPVPSLQRLFTSSEFLEQGMRQFIESSFQAEIFDHYGSTEFKEVAWECPEHGFYHINNDELICEVLENGQPVFDTPGEIVITDLRNKAMPLIRYSMGDLGVMSKDPCACGYQGYSMKPLGGRSSDYLILPEGQQLSPYRFTTEIEYVEGLMQYQIVQTAAECLEVAVVYRTGGDSLTGSGLSTGTEEQDLKIVSILQEALQQGGAISPFEINITQVDSISNEENGKFKVVKRRLI